MSVSILESRNGATSEPALLIDRQDILGLLGQFISCNLDPGIRTSIIYIQSDISGQGSQFVAAERLADLHLMMIKIIQRDSRLPPRRPETLPKETYPAGK
jgi:hypothetical protein